MNDRVKEFTKDSLGVSGAVEQKSGLGESGKRGMSGNGIKNNSKDC